MLAINLNSKVLNPATPEPAPLAAPVSVAFLLGASDADNGDECTPEQFFLSKDSIRQYIVGYLSVNWTPMAVLVAEHYGVEVAL